MDLGDLADACQTLSETLDKEQAAENYEGQEAMTLGKLAANLSAQATTLRTFAVADIIASSQEAINALKTGTQAINDAVDKLKIAAQAIQIAGLVLGLSAAIISQNLSGITSSAGKLIDAVKKL